MAFARLPRGIWALGLVSLFMDVSSEMIHALLPVFLVTQLGAGMATVGLIEGIGEATASIVKVFSGWLSDRLGARKALAVAGYGLAALCKPLFALATGPAWVLVARFTDRVGKGIRGAPRDALVADIAPAHLRGAAFGLRQSLDTVGAFAGPLLAIALMALSADDFRLVFWIALAPALISVAILAFAVKEPAKPHADVQDDTAPVARAPVRLQDMRRLNRAYWGVVVAGAALALARFSEAFLILRAQSAGLPVVMAPLVLVAMNVVYAAVAYPAGMLSDRIRRETLLYAGCAALIAADVVLAAASGIAAVFAGVVLWGLHLGLTQGLFAALVADAADPDLRGTAFGLFNLASGAVLLPASLLAGTLWEAAGAQATFLVGAGFTVLGTVLVGIAGRRSIPQAH